VSDRVDVHRPPPQEAAQFESEPRHALARAGADLGVARVEEVMARWHTRACILANALTDREQELLTRTGRVTSPACVLVMRTVGWTTP
jgi:hypothetical protein